MRVKVVERNARAFDSRVYVFSRWIVRSRSGRLSLFIHHHRATRWKFSVLAFSRALAAFALFLRAKLSFMRVCNNILTNSLIIIIIIYRHELGRQPANTKLAAAKDVRQVRCRGGNIKFRALRLSDGNFSWGSENVTRKARIVDVVYNATNNELLRTKTLVKSAVVAIDCAPFRAWYAQHYGKKIGVKERAGQLTESEDIDDVKRSKNVQSKLSTRNKGHEVAKNVKSQFQSGRLFALITSRPGQCGRADGYILEGKELDFYVKKMQKKKHAAAEAAAAKASGA